MNKHEYIGKTLEEVKNMAMEDLRDTIDNLYIKEVPVKNGIFNKKVKIEVIEKQDIINFIKNFLLDITKKMGLTVNIEIKKRDNLVTFTLYSDNNALLIGKNGKTLDALSTITRQILQKELNKPFYILLDVEEYKLKRQNDIERLAKRIAREVSKTKIEAKLDAMNSYERRIVHNILSERKDVYTESSGEEPNRYVVIKPKED